jgi:hypothetical protein
VQERALKQKQDHIIACENKETTDLRGMNCEVDKTPAEGNENQDILDANKVCVLAQSLLNYFI